MSFVGVSMLPGMMGSFPLLRAIGCFAWPLSCTSFSPRSCFFLPGPVNSRFPIVDVQRDLAIPSSVLLAPPISSPCLGANEKNRSSSDWIIELLVITPASDESDVGRGIVGATGGGGLLDRRWSQALTCRR